MKKRLVILGIMSILVFNMANAQGSRNDRVGESELEKTRITKDLSAGFEARDILEGETQLDRTELRKLIMLKEANDNDMRNYKG